MTRLPNTVVTVLLMLTDFGIWLHNLKMLLAAATPERFTALAKTDFQTALMYLVRAVAQPTTF